VAAGQHAMCAHTIGGARLLARGDLHEHAVPTGRHPLAQRRTGQPRRVPAEQNGADLGGQLVGAQAAADGNPHPERVGHPLCGVIQRFAGPPRICAQVEHPETPSATRRRDEPGVRLAERAHPEDQIVPAWQRGHGVLPRLSRSCVQAAALRIPPSNDQTGSFSLHAHDPALDDRRQDFPAIPGGATARALRTPRSSATVLSVFRKSCATPRIPASAVTNEGRRAPPGSSGQRRPQMLNRNTRDVEPGTTR
jgi:hypothetical protein